MRKNIIRMFAVLIILAGAALLLYPLGRRYMGERTSQKVIRQFWKEAAAAAPEESSTDGGISENPSSGGDAPEEGGQKGGVLDWLLEDLQAYNEKIYAEGQVGLQDPFDYETPSFDLTQYGFSENVIGTIWIPRINQELPIYLGADTESMSKGAALLGQTSMPLGGENTNAVIAAHRGYRGIPFFSHIQELQVGDKIQITTPWDTLIYRVCELKIISPEESSEIYIRPGRDMVTLLTCHPYTINNQRYLVFAERRRDEELQSHEKDLAEAEDSYSESPRQVEEIGEDGVSRITEVPPEIIRPAFYEGAAGTGNDGAGYSNLQLWLESHAVVMGFGLVALVVIIMLIWRRYHGG